MDVFDKACERLCVAAANGNEREVLHLLERSVDYYYKNYKCFREAIKAKKVGTLKLLFEYTGILPRKSMVLTCIDFDNLEALEFLISAGAFLNVPVSSRGGGDDAELGEDEMFILDYAEKSSCSQEIINCLKRAGAKSAQSFF